MSTNITPLHDRVIVRRLKRANRFAEESSSPIPPRETAGRRGRCGRRGQYKEDGSRQPLDVKTGDRVLFGKYSGSEIKIDGEELLIMREDEILGSSLAPGRQWHQEGWQVVSFDTAAFFVSKSNSTFQQERR